VHHAVRAREDLDEGANPALGKPGLIHYAWGEHGSTFAEKGAPWWRRLGIRDAKRVVVLLVILFYASGLTVALSMRRDVLVRLSPERATLYHIGENGEVLNRILFPALEPHPHWDDFARAARSCADASNRFPRCSRRRNAASSRPFSRSCAPSSTSSATTRIRDSRWWAPSGRTASEAVWSNGLSPFASPQASRLKVIRQQHDAVGVETLRLQGIDAAQHFILPQIDHRDGAVVGIQQAKHHLHQG
jgi:hypothetical protein